MSAKLAMVCGGQVFPVKKKEIGNLAVSWDETLTLARGSESHHTSLASSHGEMRILGPIIEAFVRAVLNARHQLRFGGRIGTQLVRYHHPRCAALAREQLAHQAQGGCLVSSALQQGIEDVTVRIDGTPQPIFLALDRHHHLIELPLVGKVAPRAPPDLMGELQAEFRRPFREGLE